VYGKVIAGFDTSFAENVEVDLGASNSLSDIRLKIRDRRWDVSHCCNQDHRRCPLYLYIMLCPCGTKTLSSGSSSVSILTGVADIVCTLAQDRTRILHVTRLHCCGP